jgi:hypothetical protein
MMMERVSVRLCLTALPNQDEEEQEEPKVKSEKKSLGLWFEAQHVIQFEWAHEASQSSRPLNRIKSKKSLGRDWRRWRR